MLVLTLSKPEPAAPEDRQLGRMCRPLSPAAKEQRLGIALRHYTH